MPHDGQDMPRAMTENAVLTDLVALTAAAVAPTETVLNTAIERLRAWVYGRMVERASERLVE